MKNWISVFLVVNFLAVSGAHARDLVEAASSAQTMFNRIGIAATSIGITVGGILFAIGMANVGRVLLLSGLIGACAVLGAPAIIQLIGRIVEASV